MKQKYYKLPVRLEKLFEGDIRQLERCSELESIDQHIELLLTTCPVSTVSTPNTVVGFGSWTFERIVSTEQWKELFTGYVMQAISTYEKRISDITLSVNLQEVVREEVLDNRMIRKRVDITVLATLNSTGAPCGFGYKLYMGPLSNE
ncbi:GPW/gp25 family protein [Bacteroides fragilis]|nr:GPW/gp25 family protein [Bacteroides fragilis]